jgi:hypothetical protein
MTKYSQTRIKPSMLGQKKYDSPKISDRLLHISEFGLSVLVCNDSHITLTGSNLLENMAVIL